MTTTAEVKDFSGKLADLVKQVQAGTEVVLTEDHKPVAKIVSTSRKWTNARGPLKIISLEGHRVLGRVVSQSEIADELFEQ